MKHPTKQQVQVVIDNLLKAAAIAGDNCPVDMSTTEVSLHPCGSPMCHGGWYAVASKAWGRHSLSYNTGADFMGFDLGLVNQFGLKTWAAANPEIWGNDYGQRMFWDGRAFGLTDETLTSLHQIIDHWRGVQSRLPA